MKLKLKLLWNKLRKRIVAVAVATVLIGMVFWWSKDAATLIVYWLTAIIVLVYTYETHGMRREMVRQNDISIQPLLITSIVPRTIAGEVTQGVELNVLNIGRGPALFVRIDPIEITPGGGHSIDFEVVDYVEAGKSVVAKATFADRVSFLSSLKPKSNRTYRVTLHYEDINRRERFSVMQMGKDGIRLLDHGDGKPTG